MNSGGVYDTSCVRGGLSGDGSTAFPQKPDDTIEIDLDLDELDATSAETKAAYQEIKDYVGKQYYRLQIVLPGRMKYHKLLLNS